MKPQNDTSTTDKRSKNDDKFKKKTYLVLVTVFTACSVFGRLLACVS